MGIPRLSSSADAFGPPRKRILAAGASLAAAVLGAFLLSGCGLPFTPAKMDAMPEAKFVRDTIEHLRAGEFGVVIAEVDPAVPMDGIGGNLRRIAEVFPGGKPVSVHTIGWYQTVSAGQPRRIDLTLEYGFGGPRWVIVTAVLKGEADKPLIWGLHARAFPKSMAEMNAFTLGGRGLLGYLLVAMMALAVGITVASLVLCLRTRGLRRRSLWVVFILFGVCGWTVNWTTGESQVTLLRIFLFSAAALRSGLVGPWNLTLSLPLGALVFLYRRARGTLGIGDGPGGGQGGGPLQRPEAPGPLRPEEPNPAKDAPCR